MFTFRTRITAGEIYLWGGAGVKSDCVLLLRNDENGEPILFGQRKKIDGTLGLGTLQPGESYTINLKGLAGVFATTNTGGGGQQMADSFVECHIWSPVR